MTRALNTSEQPDLYRLLDVPPDATRDDIRRAYRRQVLEAHPDKNPHRAEWSERRTRELVYAFEVLGNEAKRRDYDARWKSVRRRRHQPREEDLFFFRRDDPESRALRILYLLVRGRGAEATPILAESEAIYGPTFLGDQLDRADYLDCLFLLGEHLIAEKRYSEALDRFLALYHREQRARFKRHYYALALDHLKSLYLRFLPRAVSPEELIATVESALRLIHWTRKETARLHLVIARAYERLGREDLAGAFVDKALRIDPGCARAKRWREEHGLAHG